MLNWPGVVLLCACGACATSEIVARPLLPEQEAKINEMVAGKDVSVTIEGEARSLDATKMRIDGDSVHYLKWDRTVSPPAWLPSEAPLASVQEVEYRNRGRGAAVGLGIGALTGVLLGVIVGQTVPWSCDRDCSGIFTAGGALIGGLGLGLVGAGIGGLVGAPARIEFKDVPAR